MQTDPKPHFAGVNPCCNLILKIDVFLSLGMGDAASRLQGRLWVNDELKQDANTRDLVLDIPGMIEMAS